MCPQLWALSVCTLTIVLTRCGYQSCSCTSAPSALRSPLTQPTTFHHPPAEEAERSLHDALCVLTETIKETRVVCGGGCMEMLMAAAIDK